MKFYADIIAECAKALPYRGKSFANSNRRMYAWLTRPAIVYITHKQLYILLLYRKNNFSQWHFSFFEVYLTKTRGRQRRYAPSSRLNELCPARTRRAPLLRSAQATGPRGLAGPQRANLGLCGRGVVFVVERGARSCHRATTSNHSKPHRPMSIDVPWATSANLQPTFISVANIASTIFAGSRKWFQCVTSSATVLLSKTKVIVYLNATRVSAICRDPCLMTILFKCSDERLRDRGNPLELRIGSQQIRVVADAIALNCLQGCK